LGASLRIIAETEKENLAQPHSPPQVVPWIRTASKQQFEK
jgi:hypothetical protein